MRIILIGTAVLTLASLGPASASPIPDAVGSGRATPVDPDAAVERLAAAGNREPRGGGHDRPGRVGDIIRDDHSAVSAAYAWLYNK